MTSNARELAQIPSTPSGRRNLVTNGAITINQRGDQTGVTSTTYVTDRIQHIVGTAGTWSISKSSDAPDGFSNSLKLDCTTANASLSSGSIYILGQKFEGQDLQHLDYGTSGAKKLTLSFFVKSNKTGTYVVEFFQDGNSRQQSQTYTIDSADTWEKKTITIDGDTSGSLANDNTSELAFYWWVVAGSDYSSGTLNTSWASSTNANRAVGIVNLADSTSNEWYVTGVQLEVGSVATEFEHRSFGEELALCERYFRTSKASGAFSYILPAMSVETSTVGQVAYDYRGMRTSPSVTASGGFAGESAGGGLTFTGSGLVGSNFMRLSFTLSAVAAAGIVTHIRDSGSGNAVFNFDSEL